MVSIRPVISKSSRHCINHLVTVARAPHTIGIIFISCSIAFSIPKQGRSTYFSFHILSVSVCGAPGQQSPQFCKFSLFVDYHKVWSSGRDLVIRMLAFFYFLAFIYLKDKDRTSSHWIYSILIQFYIQIKVF